MNWPEVTAKAHLWLYCADHFYVAARYLYWKGLIREFAFLGAHAIELYLKAYLIQKTDCYPEGHDLVQIYSECMEHDMFFLDKSLRECFRLRDDNVSSGTDWPLYIDAIKYPEYLPSQKQRGKKFRPYAIGLGLSHNSLDQIASFVRRNIKIPSNTVDYIEELLNKEYLTGELAREMGSLDEIRESFLRENDCFRK